MPKISSPTRRPASRHRTAPTTARHELITKRRGELSEIRFTLKAATQGFAVSKPYGDSERYDFILDAAHVGRAASAVQRRRSPRPRHPRSPAPQPSEAGTLYRIQVKCSTQLLNGLYRVNAHRRTHGRAVPYLPSEIDFLIAYIIPEDTWYVIPIRAVRATSLLFRRKKDRRPGLYDKYREAWHLLCRK